MGWTNTAKKVVGISVFVVVDMRDGSIKKATVFVWSLTKHHHTKSAIFAQALIAQKPIIDKTIMMLAKKILLYGGTKSSTRLQGILDHIKTEIERTDNILKMIYEESVQFEDLDIMLCLCCAVYFLSIRSD
eukprot:15350296-Ditylum_brightwellii.AAC.1